MRWTTGLLAAVAALFALLLGATAAPAATVTNERPLLFSFDGSDTPAGKFSFPRSVEIDQANGLVYVVDRGNNVLDKFNLAGVAQSFSSTGSASLSPGFAGGLALNDRADVAVDNSATNPGRIYLIRENGPAKAFSPAGSSLWELNPSVFGATTFCGVAVDTAGHPWIADASNKVAREYASTGSPPAETGSVSVTSGNPCRLDVDASGNLYVNRNFGGVDKYEAGVKGPTIDATASNGVTVDQSGASGHIFTIHNANFNEYEANGTLVKTFGVPGARIGSGNGVAYDKGTDRVYVADSNANAIEVYGPAASGTVPDATTEAASAIEVTKATANGKANPLSLPASSYRFEYKEGTGSSWATAKSTASTSLPVETNEIAVSKAITGLKGNTTYQTRLATTNDENGLTVYSTPVNFKTATAAAAPAVTIAAPSSITTTSAHVSGTVDPKEDQTTWRVQKSTDPACVSGFSNEATQTIPSETAGTANVEFNLANLLPNQHYCVRISATNSAGTTNSEAKEFMTPVAAPTQVLTAFAAPRTDTSARLNGYVNPEGAPITYHFDYSEDGGSTWIPLPDDEDTSNARRQIVVASELTGLDPQTTYSYRFTAQNDGGTVQTAAAAFETRSTAEMQLPQRGIELVNPPNKGNQNIAAETTNRPTIVSSDGNRVVWKVYAGAPDGTTGTEVNFLSTHTPSGWQTHAIAPPPAQQVGEGGDAYKFNAATPDLRHFIMRAEVTDLLNEGPPTFVRLDDQQNQDVLQAFPNTQAGQTYENADITDDGAHVILANYNTEQLEEVSSEPHEVVSIMPDGQPAECGVKSGNFFGFAGGAGNGTTGEQFRFPDYHRMATTDASRVYFQASPNGGSCTASIGHWQALYYRDRNTGQTVEIDPGTASQSPALVRATPDGRSVIFVTNTAHSPEDENASRDVYRWDADGDHYTCITCVANGGGAVVGRVLVSDDFSHVYFSASQQLIPGRGPGVYSVSGAELNYVGPVGAWLGTGAELGAQLSSDGNVLIFRTSHSGGNTEITADEQAAECKVIGNQGVGIEKQPGCQAIMRYEDSTNSLECLSCRPHGVTTDDVGEENEIAAMSADGQTVAFVTHEPLLPQDINNTYDVYEWHNGAIRLITDGETPYPATGVGVKPRVFGMSDSGNDLFFTVIQPGLTGYEEDELSNLYDARVGGGFPRPTEAVHCSEEACQGPLAPPPPMQSVGSSKFSGSGNQPAVRKGRCAAKRGKARRRCAHKKHHKKHKRHQRKKRSAKRHAGHLSDRGNK